HVPPTRTLTQAQSTPATGKRGYSLERQLQLWGWLFISPWIAGFLLLILFPMIASLAFSFTNFNLLHPDEIQFIGLKNYQNLLTDPLVGTAVGATLRFAVLALPVSILLPIVLAGLLNSPLLKAKRLFLTLFYMPYIVPVVSVVFIWQSYLNQEAGWLNRLLAVFGITGPNWINSVDFIYPAMVLIGLWGLGNALLITVAAMRGIPTELFEAAKVDGAGGLTVFRRITIPLISPVIFYNLILAVIAIFRFFDIPYILGRGQGQPGNATYFYSIHLYKNAFTYQDMGYGSTLAWVLFAAALIVTVTLFLTSRFWVFYSTGDNQI
ncbi:MAG TPA: sugar ABC transporter permease, partial [Phototrophicaceae bacterium]|nr:sugar ABC transporter permease [Phototrophicaceae bacterium]